MSTYAGVPSYPATLTLPDDGPGKSRTAGSVNVPLQGLADRAAYLKAQIDLLNAATAWLRYLNWPVVVNIAGAGSVANTLGAAWDDSTNQLFVIGFKSNQPAVWSVPHQGGLSPELLADSAVATASELPCAIAVGGIPGSPKFVVSTNTRYVFVGGPFGWAKYDGFGAAVSSTSMSAAVLDNVRGRFVIMTSNGIATVVRYASDAVTYSSGVAPAGWSTYAVYRMACRRDTGRVLAVASSGGSVQVAVTDNAGGAWTTRAAITTAMTGTNLALGLSFDAYANRWLLTIGNTNKSEVWSSSDDGVSWTQLASFSSCTLGTIASDGTALVATCSSTTNYQRGNGIVMSLDGGTTWRFVGPNTGSTPPNNGSPAPALGSCLFAAGGFIAVPASQSNPVALFGLRTGTPGSYAPSALLTNIP